MKENNAPVPPSVPGVDVKVYLPKDPEKDHGKLLGFASINLGGVFAVNGIRIYDTEKGPFIAMPSTKGKDDKYHDICCPTTKEMREAVNTAILGAYQKEVEQERPSVRDAIKQNSKEAAARSAPDQQKQRAADKGER